MKHCLIDKVVRQLLASILLMMSYHSYALATATTWQSLDQGLSYSKHIFNPQQPWGALHVFKINLEYYSFNLALSNDHGRQASSVRHLARQVNAPLAINGGFFTPDFQPLGLRINQGKQLAPLKNISWWGVFAIANKRATLSTAKQFRAKAEINFAIQSGPRLLDNGVIPKLKVGKAERSALCIRKDGQIIIAATQNAPVSTTKLASQLRKSEDQGGYACRYALNLDGGHSTQLYAENNDFRLNVIGFASVTDIIYIKKRAQ